MKKRLSLPEKISLVKRAKRGECVSQICLKAGISRTSLYNWLKKYKQAASRGKKKALQSKNKRGKQHWQALSSKITREVKKLAIKDPSLSIRQISASISVVGLESVSPKGVWQILKKNGLSTQADRNRYIGKHGQTLVRCFSPEDKLTMIRRYLAGEKLINLADEFQVSRTVFYRWYHRYQQADASAKKEALFSLRPKGERHWRTVPKARDYVLKIVSQRPRLSVHQIPSLLPKVRGKPILGSHGVYNLLKKLNLNTWQRRVVYSQSLAQPIKVRPVVGLPTWLRGLIGSIPVLSAIPPPAITSLKRLAQALQAGPPTWQRVISFGKNFFLSFLTSIPLGLGLLSWVNIIIQAPTLTSKVGIIFASIALLMGMFFFSYSMKYYLTLGLVLSFSSQRDEEDKEKQKRLISGRGILGLLGRVFGVEIKVKSEAGRQVSRDKFWDQSGQVRQGVGLRPDLSSVELQRYPFISVQLPMFNEKRVAERLLKACAQMDYPNFEILVCDDSTDETTAIVERYAQKWNQKRSKLKDKRYTPEIRVLHRSTRAGFKGAALGYALKKVNPRTEFIVVFDADFVPYPDTLEQFAKYFQTTVGSLEKKRLKQSRTAVVGGYQWHVLNKSENWITRGVRTEYAGSYVIERAGREVMGLLKQISGSVYMIRRDVLEEVGWGTSITEDFELTLKLYEKGYKVEYTPYIQAPAECVSTLKRLIRQRMRWAEGHSNNIKKMFSRLLFGR
ncbi:glycosyltransferase, partial [Patescibacteria group bacterium]